MYVAGSKVLVVNGVALFEKLGEHEHELVIDDLFKAAKKGYLKLQVWKLNITQNLDFQK